MFKDMGPCWNRLYRTKTHRLCGMHVGGKIQLAVLLWNCHNSFVGSQTSLFFKVDQIHVEYFLGIRTGSLPNFVRERRSLFVVLYRFFGGGHVRGLAHFCAGRHVRGVATGFCCSRCTGPI